MTQVETEVKLYYPNFDAIKDHLERLNAELIQARVYERNVRYDLDDESLTKRGIVIRLREDNAVKLTYKERGSIERGIITREELEVEVSDFDVMQQILDKFGYMPSMLYEKYRTTYSYNEVYIMLDELPYGKFVEIEGDADSIENAISVLNLDTVERREASYMKLFDYVKHHMELPFRDLTFENFSDIDVPESAFIPPGSIVIR